MMRVVFSDDENGTLLLRLEGRLVAPYAEDARLTLARHQVPARIVVDVSEVSFIDSSGEEVLSWLGLLGATFVGANVYTRCICERLQLRMTEQHPMDHGE